MLSSSTSLDEDRVPLWSGQSFISFAVTWRSNVFPTLKFWRDEQKFWNSYHSMTTRQKTSLSCDLVKMWATDGLIQYLRYVSPLNANGAMLIKNRFSLPSMLITHLSYLWPIYASFSSIQLVLPWARSAPKLPLSRALTTMAWSSASALPQGLSCPVPSHSKR